MYIVYDFYDYQDYIYLENIQRHIFPSAVNHQTLPYKKARWNWHEKEVRVTAATGMLLILPRYIIVISLKTCKFF
jgi:hypothetical protein